MIVIAMLRLFERSFPHFRDTLLDAVGEHQRNSDVRSLLRGRIMSTNEELLQKHGGSPVAERLVRLWFFEAVLPEPTARSTPCFSASEKLLFSQNNISR